MKKTQLTHETIVQISPQLNKSLVSHETSGVCIHALVLYSGTAALGWLHMLLNLQDWCAWCRKIAVNNEVAVAVSNGRLAGDNYMLESWCAPLLSLYTTSVCLMSTVRTQSSVIQYILSFHSSAVHEAH
jgi:hypothetical protein